MKKIITGTILAAAVTALGASFAFAQEPVQVNTQGIVFEIPAQFSDLLTVQEDGLEDGMIVAVYDKGSVEAAEAMGQGGNGAGFLFGISAVPEAKMKELRCGAMDGMEVFAEDEDIYYVFNHPTDVTLVRDTNEEMDAAMEVWGEMNDWAYQEVRQEILANNPELDDEFYTNTELDMFLAQAAFKPGTEYELRSVDFGPDPLDPSVLIDNDYIEDLADDFTYEELPDVEAPDGQYYVIAFNMDGEEIRFDFFDADLNMIRETKTIDGDEYTTIYQSIPKEMDEDDTTTGLVREMCAAIANGGEIDD